MTATEVAGGSQSDGKQANEGSGNDGGSPTIMVTNSTEDDATVSTYHLKWIPWNSGKIPIVMQSINGPCPLIATMNVLLLREKVKLPSMLEQITATQLLTYLGECIMDSVPDEGQTDENATLNLEQNLHDAMEILPKLKTGLDVNIRFTGITDFEYTPECIIFDLLRIPLYHGWLSDPSLTEVQNVIGNQSYNQLVDNIITNKTSTDQEVMARVLIAEEFLERTASQLTLHGLNELKSKIKDNEIGILFRNNHFLTLFKRESEIYTLVTDHGYLTEDNIIWETLDNIEGAGRFFDSNFQLSEVTNRQVSEFTEINQLQQQLENDFLIALSLKAEETGFDKGNLGTEDDFELAKRLQEEEDKAFGNVMTSTNRDQRLSLRIIERDFPRLGANDSVPLSESTSIVPRTDPQSIEPASEAYTSMKEHPRPQQSQQQPHQSQQQPHQSRQQPQQSQQQPQQSQLQPVPETSTDTAPRSSSRRIKSEKNSKESNCIVN